MIRFTSETDTSGVNDMTRFLSGVPSILLRIGTAVVAEIRTPMLAELQRYPPERSYPQDYPLEWTSERQRRAYFATDGFGAGIPYKRTGGLAAAWSVTGRQSGGEFLIVVENSADSAKYVIGSLAQQLARARRFQQGFHAITGWGLASPTVQKWIAEAEDRFAQRFAREMGSVKGFEIRGRAYTKGTRRR